MKYSNYSLKLLNKISFARKRDFGLKSFEGEFERGTFSKFSSQKNKINKKTNIIYISSILILFFFTNRIPFIPICERIYSTTFRDPSIE